MMQLDVPPSNNNIIWLTAGDLTYRYLQPKTVLIRNRRGQCQGRSTPPSPRPTSSVATCMLAGPPFQQCAQHLPDDHLP